MRKCDLWSSHCPWGMELCLFNANICLRCNKDIKNRHGIKHIRPQEVQPVFTISWRNQEISWFDCRGCWGIAPSKENLWLAAGAHVSRSVLISPPSALPQPLGPLFCGGAHHGSAGVMQKRNSQWSLMRSNPLIIPAASLQPHSETCLIALHVFGRGAQAAARWLPCTRLVSVKKTHVVFVLRSAAGTDP